MRLHYKLVASCALWGCLLAEPVSAVSLSADGRGQVLLYPYYTAQGGNDTLISVVNYGGPKALKVRFLEGRNGRSVLDLNLYLGGFDTWVAALTRDGAGQPMLRVFDRSCTVPELAASPTVADTREVPLSNSAYANYDRAGSELDRAAEGYIEILEMGGIDSLYELSSGVRLSDSLSNCALLAAGWANGGAFTISNGAELSAPTGGLFGGATIINVPEGTAYSYDAVALATVFAAKRHTAPGSASPNLGEATPSSLVVVNDEAVRSTWSSGIDAVSAVLMHHTVLNEYNIDPAIGASTDVVLTFPTKPFYAARESDTAAATRAPFTARFDDMEPRGFGASGPLLADGTSTGACDPMSFIRVGRNQEIIMDSSGLIGSASLFFPPPLTPDTLCWTANVISFGNVLGSSNVSPIADPIAAQAPSTSGMFRMMMLYPLQRLQSNEGHLFFGLPVIGFAVQKYVNDTLQLPQSSGAVLSNYGGTFIHKYVTSVCSGQSCDLRLF